jgi:hypothetical protein
MTRPLTAATRRAIFVPETDEVFLTLLTLNHASLESPLRVTSDAVDTTSRGNLFTAYPFDLSLPDDNEERAPRARLSIDNIDRTIIRAIRSLDTPPEVLIEIVRAADPDTVEASFSDFKLTNVRYDAHLVQGDLSVEDFTTEPFPSSVFSPSLFPGLF